MATSYYGYGNAAGTPPMTPGQKAAATRRARRAAGLPPKTSGRRSTGTKRTGPVFAKVDGRALAIEGLSKLEDALGALITPANVTPELDAKFKTYQKVKALALNAGTPAEGRNALSRALRTINELIATIL